MQWKLSKTLEAFVVAAALALLTCYGYLGWNAYISDSEIWSVNLGFHFPEEWKNSWVYTRFFFYLPVYLASLFSSSAAGVFYSARCLMLLNVLLQVFLIYKISFTLTKSRFVSWLGLFLILTNSFFLTQSYRLRSDLVSTSFLLAGVAFFYGTLKTRAKTTVIAACLLGALFSTPKVVFVLPAALWILTSFAPAKIRAKGLVGFILGCFVILGMGLGLRLGPFSDLVSDLVHYFTAAVSGDRANESYLSAKAFSYILQFFTENPIFDIYLALPFLLLLVPRSRQAMLRSPWFITYLFIFAAFFLVPDRLPFFICSLIPLLSLAALLLSHTGISQWTPLRVKTASTGIFILVFLLIFGLWSLHSFSLRMADFLTADNNHDQIDYIQKLDKYLTENPKVSYYDVIGLVPQRSQYRYFLGPHQYETNSLVSEILLREKPDLILGVAKAYYFNQEFLKKLDSDYLMIGNGVYLKSENVDVPATTNTLKDKYANLVVTAEGEPFIFVTVKDYLESNPKTNWRLKRISTITAPMDMPPRGLEMLFRFDTEF